jgi:hypothetical protein
VTSLAEKGKINDQFFYSERILSADLNVSGEKPRAPELNPRSYAGFKTTKCIVASRSGEFNEVLCMGVFNPREISWVSHLVFCQLGPKL